MIRITTATTRNGVIITVDGEIVGEYVETIDTVVKQASGAGGPVRLFLRDVSRIDQSGRNLLGRLAEKNPFERQRRLYFLHRCRNKPVRGAAQRSLGRRGRERMKAAENEEGE